MPSTPVLPDLPATAPVSTDSGHQAGALLAWSGVVLVLVARGYRAFLLTLVVAATVPMVFSWTSYVVRSGSMEPGLSVGDVVAGKPHPAGSPVPVGRVMIFDNPDRASSHGVMVHRVVENLGKGMYVTAGDANPGNDSTPVPAENFTARGAINVPFIGLPLTWLAGHDLAALLTWLVITALALYFSSRPPCDPRHRRRREASRARRAAERAGAVLHRGAAPIVAVVTLVVAALVGVPLAQADAAFSASTNSRASTWKVSTTLSQSLVLSDPGEIVRGTVPLTATLTNTANLAYSVRIEYAPAGTTSWQTVCTKSAAPYKCDWATTTTLANQDYDLRAVATAGFSMYTSPTVEDVLVDNAAPTVIMQNPGTPLRGSVTVSADATDSHSGVAKVVIQYALTGSTTWRDICTIEDSPYACKWDTTVVAGGSYTLRAVGTDLAGNVATSATVANRVVDNSVPSVTMDDPGAFLNGTVSLTASASSSAGVTSVRIQRAPTGTTTWTDVCTDTSSPYSCSFATTTVADGLYDFRAVLLDGGGKTTTSATVASRRIDNSPLRAYDIQTANGGSTVGRLEPGDSITFTYSQQVKLSTITSGWTGSATAVTLRLRDGNLLGTGNTGDTIDILRNGSAVNLGSVNLKQDYTALLRTQQFAATMTASSTTVNGFSATRIVITVGSQSSGSAVRTSTVTSTMVWTPSATATDLAGKASSVTPASESGAADREF